MPGRRSGTVARSIVTLTALLVSVPAAADEPGDRGPTELIVGHVNDLLSGADNNDDLYTASMILGARHRGWDFGLIEHMFTDRFVNGIRFDETYLTVARDFRPGDGGWILRAEAGAVHVGKGIYGERFQNFFHRLIDHEEYFLQYVEDGTHLQLGLRASRRVAVGERFALTPVVEAETAGFKRHALVALAADYEVAPKFNIGGEVGFRWTRTDFAELDVFVEDSDPAFGIGMSYKRWFDLRWTKNYFGTGSAHWHLLWRISLGKNPD